jgi:hypothetical protein
VDVVDMEIWPFLPVFETGFAGVHYADVIEVWGRLVSRVGERSTAGKGKERQGKTEEGRTCPER